MRQIKQALLNEYGSFSDKRIKNIDRGSSFIVDDRGPGDIGADKQLFSYFCRIFAEVVSPTEVKVSLDGNVPTGASLRQWLLSHAADFSAGDLHQHLTVVVQKGGVGRLSSLASAFRAIVMPGAARYDSPNYKYVCPRTAKALDRLERVLKQVWGA